MVTTTATCCPQPTGQLIHHKSGSKPKNVSYAFVSVIRNNNPAYIAETALCVCLPLLSNPNRFLWKTEEFPIWRWSTWKRFWWIRMEIYAEDNEFGLQHFLIYRPLLILQVHQLLYETSCFLQLPVKKKIQKSKSPWKCSKSNFW